MSKNGGMNKMESTTSYFTDDDEDNTGREYVIEETNTFYDGSDTTAKNSRLPTFLKDLLLQEVAEHAAMGMDFVVGVVGLVVLAHAAFSTVQYRGILKVRDEEFVWPSFQVLIEVCISLVLCFWAALKVPGQFLPILPDLEGDRLAHLSENLDFITFNHRGKVFPLEMDRKLNFRN